MSYRFFVKQLETAGFRVVKLMEIFTSPSPRDNVRQVVSAPHLWGTGWLVKGNHPDSGSRFGARWKIEVFSK